MNQYRAVLACAVSLGLMTGCGGGPVAPTTTPTPSPADTAPPPVTREFRGLWVATVNNIDWPSRTGLTADQQRSELLTLLDGAAATGVNAVLLQVRPAGDALYRSSIEPWGRMFSGTQGTDPGWDPLAVAVEAAHERGLELHAWVNPFRAGNTADSARFAPTHLVRTRPDLIVWYGSQLWMNPGEPAVHDHTMRVIQDIIARYDVDGIHLDDYFYPYPQRDSANRIIAFADSATFARSGGGMALADWRRANVDRFVDRLYREVHATKPFVKVGISPFGIWRPGNPAGVTGLDAYAEIYADARKWLQNGWLDYAAPQLYWQLASTGQPFAPLLDWWIAQSAQGRHVWPGLAAYRLYEGSPLFAPDEIAQQIRTTRERPRGTGHLLYNTTSVLRREAGALGSSLQRNVYQLRAVPPAYPWLDNTAPGAPTITVTSDASATTIRVAPAIGEPVRWWVVRARVAGQWTMRTSFGTRTDIVLPGIADRVLVNAIDRAGNESPAVSWAR